MRNRFSEKLVGVVAVVLAIGFSPIAQASPNETAIVSSGGAAATNNGFDASGEAINKVVMPLVGALPQGVPNRFAGSTAVVSGNGIVYHDGKVMNASTGVDVNVIWYGAWSNLQKDIVRSAISGLSGSAYFKINTTYGDATANVANIVTLKKEVSDNYSQGKGGGAGLSDSQIWTIVKTAAGASTSETYTALIKNVNAITLVLTSVDVKKSGFLRSYCGWHTYNTSLNYSVKYSFVGNPGTSTSCGAQATSTNGDRGVDAMASIIAHEVEEAATDPELNAWYDNNGYENADKCAWKFGTATTTDPNGFKWNITLGGKNYLVQQNWANAGGGYCGMALK